MEKIVIELEEFKKLVQDSTKLEVLIAYITSKLSSDKYINRDNFLELLVLTGINLDNVKGAANEKYNN